MMIRMLTIGQLPEALAMANDLFDKEMAPYVSASCTASFHAFASADMITNLMQAGKLHIWGAFDETGQLVGVSSMNDPYHISMLCVKETHRRQGISRSLLETMASYGSMPGQEHPLTINALAPSVPYLEHVGFKPAGPQMTMMDVTYLPMQKGMIQPAFITPAQLQMRSAGMPGTPSSRMPGWLKIVIALICVLAFAIFVYAVSLIVTKSAGLSAGQDGTSDFQEYMEQFNQDQKETEKPEAQEPENTGISSIPAYTQKNLSYQIKDKAFSENEKEGKYTIQLSVHYPQLEGAGDQQKQINKLIKDFALETEKEIYESPDEAQKKKVLELETVYVYNEVTYNTTYASDHFISIVFNDVSLLGDANETGTLQVRALNIDLDKVRVYEPSEVFDISQESFQKTWEASVTSEAGDALGSVLPSFDPAHDTAILTGQDKDYPPAYFVDKDGVEIGFSILNQKENAGWVTGPISKDEIIKYKTDSDFWEKVTWK